MRETRSRLQESLVAGSVAVAAVAGYLGVWRAPFIFDDEKGIVQNPTIRHWWTALVPPGGGTAVSGRPMVNLSYALNYAWGGLAVEGYHAVNVALHAACALLLFGCLRRTLLRVPGVNIRRDALPLAWAAAVIWAAHPLLTETVTCIAQRTEGLMALFYLLTWYGFVRGIEDGAARPWLAVSVVACALGMATKETMVTAPGFVLLYDRCFVAGTFGAALRRRRRFYSGLAATWLILAALLVAYGGNRGEAAGLGLGVTPWSYALTQCQAILHYLRLVVWPHPLVVDYGTGVVAHASEVWGQAAALGLLLAGTVAALRYFPRAGFCAAAFFLVLAPSSSVVPLVAQTVAEHRMYLPSAAAIVLIVLALHRGLGARVAWAAGAAAVVLLFANVRRNADYRSALALWRQNTAARPGNPRSHLNFALALEAAGDATGAQREFRRAIELAPDYTEAHYDLGLLEADEGHRGDATDEFERAVALNPRHAKAEYSLGSQLAAMGRWPEAIDRFEAALRAAPQFADAEQALGYALLRVGRVDEASAHLQAALAANSADVPARLNLGALWLQEGRTQDAIGQFEQAVRIAPSDAQAHADLAATLFQAGRAAEAVPEFQEASRLSPEDPGAWFRLANALAVVGRPNEAIEAYASCLRLDPNNADAHFNRASELAMVGRFDEARSEVRKTLALSPDDPGARRLLAQLDNAR